MATDQELTNAADNAAAEATRLQLQDPNAYIALIEGLHYECTVDPEDMRYLIVKLRMPIFGSDLDEFEPETHDGPHAASAISSFCYSVSHGVARGRMMTDAMIQQSGDDN